LSLLLYQALDAGRDFSSLLNADALAAHGFSMMLSVITSAAFAVVALLAAARMFQTADY
jgi:hypothetical protein